MTLEINAELDKEIVQFLAQNPGDQASKDIANGIGAEPETVAKRLFDLNCRSRVRKFKTGSDRKNVYQLILASDIPVPAAEATQQAIAPTSQAKKDTIDLELDALQEKLNPMHKIEDREKKINVLDRLSLLLDDSIADVLTNISQDLMRLTKETP